MTAVNAKIYGALWYLTIIVGSMQLMLAWKKSDIDLAAIKHALYAGGPLLVLSLFSIWWHGLPFSRIDFAEVLIGLCLFYAILSSIRFDAKAFIAASKISIAIDLCLAVYEVFYAHTGRASAFGNSINFAIAAVLMSVALFQQLIVERAARLGTVLICACAIAVVFFSGSRGPVMALIAVIVSLVAMTKRPPVQAGFFSKAATPLFWTTAFGILICTIGARSLQEIDDPSKYLGTSSGVRLQLVEASVKQIAASPQNYKKKSFWRYKVTHRTDTASNAKHFSLATGCDMAAGTPIKSFG